MGRSSKVMISEWSLRLAITKSPVPAISSPNRTHREHSTHRSASMVIGPTSLTLSLWTRSTMSGTYLPTSR